MVQIRAEKDFELGPGMIIDMYFEHHEHHWLIVEDIESKSYGMVNAESDWHVAYSWYRSRKLTLNNVLALDWLKEPGIKAVYVWKLAFQNRHLVGEEELFHWQQPSSKFIQSTADILNNAADDISNESYSEAHAKINWAIGRLEGQSKSLEKIIDEDTCEAE